MIHLPRLSEAVYVGLCHKIGSPTEVKMRREVMHTTEVVKKPVNMMKGYERLKSGSMGEGFRMRTSDIDWMFWIPDHKVICHGSQISLYRTPQHTVILMESDHLPPGFTRLNLMTPSNNSLVRSSCVAMNNKIYISSILFRDTYLRLLRTCDNDTALSTSHGPCSTFVVVGGLEADFAFCFWSHLWPTNALPWIHRCRQQGWPSENVVSNILSGGFHVVPIGSTPTSGEEWRISFSKAEQKCVYAMNHSQFLCYGLFKIFLKEVINFQNDTPVLCSYFIKTIVFWVIQNHSFLIWTPDNLLSCFWECFKLLIYWVHIGECPNFFLPQHNMFRMKVTGSVQVSLFVQLHDLHCKGISCLLLSKSIRSYLSKAILIRSLSICTNESSIISSITLDFSLSIELQRFAQRIFHIKEFAICMKHIERLICEGLAPYQEVTLQYMTSTTLRNTAIFIQNSIHPNKNPNKVYYKATCNKASVMLKLSCKLGYVSDILYLAMFFYRTRMYEHSVRCVQTAKDRMFLPYIMYRGKVDVDMYRHYMRGVSLVYRFRRAIANNIVLDMMYTYIDELVLEQKIVGKNGLPNLYIPPAVMLHMLSILNHHRLGNRVSSQQSLRDLQNLLLYDEGFYVPASLRDISWQILGICQQICGDYSGSLQSYQYSLQQKSCQKIQEATLLRMYILPHELL